MHQSHSNQTKTSEPSRFGKMAAMLETSQLRSIPELSEQSHADFSSLIPLQ